MDVKISVKKDGSVVRGRTVLGRVERADSGWDGSSRAGDRLVTGARTRKAAVDALCAALEAAEAAEEAERRAAWEERRRVLAAAEVEGRKEAEDPRCLELYAARIAAAVPAGWTAETYAQEHWYDRDGFSRSRYTPEEQNKYRRNEHLEGAVTVILRGEREVLIWRLSRVSLADGYGLSSGAVAADGTTCFIGDRGTWLSFDRTGVDSSFHSGSLRDPAEVVRGELARIEKAREVGAQMLSIPGFGWRVHRDALPELKARLAAGGSHSFTPAGFGTGKRVSTRRPPGCYGVTRLPDETAAFFGVPVLWAEDLDCD